MPDLRQRPLKKLHKNYKIVKNQNKKKNSRHDTSFHSQREFKILSDRKGQ